MPYVISRHVDSSDETNIFQFPTSSPRGHQEDQSVNRSHNHVHQSDYSSNCLQDTDGVNCKRQGGMKLSGHESLGQSDQLPRSPDDVDWISLSCQLTYLRTTLQTARNANHVRRVELDSIGVALENIRSRIHCNDEANLSSTRSPTPKVPSFIASRNHLSIVPAGVATARILDGRTTRISGLQFPAPPRSASIQSPMTPTLKFASLKSQDVGLRQSSFSPSVNRLSITQNKSTTDPSLNHTYRSLPRTPALQHKKLNSINSDTSFDFFPRQSAASELSLFYQRSLKGETVNNMTSDIEPFPAQLISSPLPMRSSPINHYQDEIETEWDKMEDVVTHARPSATWPRFSRLRSLSDKLRVVSRQKLPKKAKSLPQLLSYL
ncbi:hypothetical protein DFH28DRAFT_1091590 [Melampsora americana]|nr:hypothetical protein DFH28DRAFT_1091590 [Melampsora americana]